MITLYGEQTHWKVIHDADPRGRELADRHYSRKTKGGKWFCGIGEKIVLLSEDEKALFVWRRSDDNLRLDNQTGVECTIFRNEGPLLSSILIKEAVEIARERWPNQRLFTYVNPKKIRSSNPGHCFLMADWKRVGWNKNHKLRILELMP